MLIRSDKRPPSPRLPQHPAATPQSVLALGLFVWVAPFEFASCRWKGWQIFGPNGVKALIEKRASSDASRM